MKSLFNLFKQSASLAPAQPEPATAVAQAPVLEPVAAPAVPAPDTSSSQASGAAVDAGAGAHAVAAPAEPAAQPAAAPAGPAHRRFLKDNPIAYQKAVAAAEAYVDILEQDGDKWWLYQKPFDQRNHNQQYFRLMYDVLNILQAMDIKPGGRVLEIGSGPGWVTEILLALGFAVDALEPAADMVSVARERVAAAAAHYRLPGELPMRFHQTTVEDMAFDDGEFDAILYFDSLHHIHDEHDAIAKSFRYLKPGGCLGVVEGAWHPDFKELEAGLMAEMEKYGTLENPFSVEYLDQLLDQAGFIEVQRYVGVNGFFTHSQLAQLHHAGNAMAGSNNVTARKPSREELQYPPCTDLQHKTDARFALQSATIAPGSRQATVQVAFTNTGDTIFSNRQARVGHVTFALRRGAPGSDGFAECKERHLLPEMMIPGKTITLQLAFTLPAGASLDGWELDAIAEGVFWFSSRGVAPCPVPLA